MLNININLIFVIVLNILFLFFEVFHFGSDVYIIIMSESFLCFYILLYILFFVFNVMFVSGLDTITFKYNYINIFCKNIVNLNIYIYNIFINTFIIYIYYFLKFFKLHQNLKNKLKFELLLTYIFLKIKNNNRFNQINYNLSLFI